MAFSASDVVPLTVARANLSDLVEQVKAGAEKIITKKPTADLFQGQTDEADLGFSYADVDQLLYQMVDDRRSAEELRAMGFDPEFVAAIQRKIRINQFKRRPPLIAKLSHRTINVDFRYVRDWGV